ncbi:penicillin-insensitive murein endopeptidase [Inquilinus sp. CAU 1745]|uniref:penicillin-insensitive murein endopeptidase n=1 Tax=Inquilinus sp. CAU 1745 TaxID=3140369 RepID=UPI00325B4ACB
MAPHIFVLLLAALFAALPAVAEEVAEEVAWSNVREPAPGPAASIGSYANGCVAGAEPLPIDGLGYQVIRPSRHRYYGHPALIEYLEDFGARMAAAGLGVALIADMSQPRGGPMSYGHASHQIGLDADIWMRLDLPFLPPDEREDLEPVVMIDRDAFRADPTVFTDSQAEMVRLAADDPRVARIFIHPALKQALCRRDWADRSWLRTIRPWYGHDYHFHVRLHCPAGSETCVEQAPPPRGDGCGGEVASWFPDPDRPPEPPSTTPPEPRPPKTLPAACQALLPGSAG